MTFLSGLPLMFGGYFVSGNEVRFILPMAGIACMVVASFLVWKAENDARLKAEALVYHPIIDIRQSYLFLDPPKRKVWKAKLYLRRASTTCRSVWIFRQILEE